MIKVRRALVSVSDKRGIVDFARGLEEFGIEIIATGGTARELRDAGIEARSVEEVIGSPPLAGGRVKTLHPALFAAILAPRAQVEGGSEEGRGAVGAIDLVVVNFYPFGDRLAESASGEREEAPISDPAIEAIDIGGPAMARAAAKNWDRVAVIVEPDDYGSVLAELRKQEGGIARATRRALAARVFRHCARYDSQIGGWLEGEKGSLPESLPERIGIGLTKVADLRYGENPHQKAALYTEGDSGGRDLAGFEQLSGVEPSYTNLLDLDAARAIVSDYDEPTCAIIKHCNPCGVGRGGHVVEAYERALSTDPRSAFGGVIGINRAVDKELASLIVGRFYDLVVAPSFDGEAMAILRTKKRLRLMAAGSSLTGGRLYDMRSIDGGLLIQEADRSKDPAREWRVVTRREPTKEELEALGFGWRVVRHVRSNAVVISNSVQTLGIGAGQMSRIEPVELAVRKAAFAGLSLVGAALASDGFFPFRDSVDVAQEAGVAAIIQPGGSRRDAEVIAAADEHGMAMVFSGIRHFRH